MTILLPFPVHCPNSAIYDPIYRSADLEGGRFAIADASVERSAAFFFSSFLNLIISRRSGKVGP
jgi:hypothetical protein